MRTFKAEDYRRRIIEELDGWSMRITSYRLEGRYVAIVDNLSPGATVARAEGESRDEAERRACEEARTRLASARRFPVDQKA